MTGEQLGGLGRDVIAQAPQLASTAVRTTGINWESVAAIGVLVGILVTVLLWVFGRQDARRERATAELRQDMTSSIDHLSEVLTAKLETKDTVARITERIARVEAVVGIPAGVNHAGPASSGG